MDIYRIISVKRFSYFLLKLSAAVVLPILLIGCASHTRVFKSPARGISIKYASDEEDRWVYTVSDSDGNSWGRIASIITEDTRKIRRSDDNDQQIIWSPSGATALIYENVSDASPDYQHILVRFDYDLKKFKSYSIDLGIRRASDYDMYGHWPSIRYLTDREIGLSWHTVPTESVFRIEEYISEYDKALRENIYSGPVY